MYILSHFCSSCRNGITLNQYDITSRICLKHMYVYLSRAKLVNFIFVFKFNKIHKFKEKKITKFEGNQKLIIKNAGSDSVYHPAIFLIVFISRTDLTTFPFQKKLSNNFSRSTPLLRIAATTYMR